METITTYKNRAIASLTNKWGAAALVTLIYMVITYFVCGVAGWMNEFLSSVMSLLLAPMAWGLTVIFLGVARGEGIENGRLFDGFKDYSRIFTTILLQGIYTFLWALLLIVPGIIKSYSYAMTQFILKDNPELSNNAAIERSMELMEGRKMQLFLLDLSMIGWAILSVLTCGIGFLFLMPYVYTAHAHFYEDALKEEGYGRA